MLPIGVLVGRNRHGRKSNLTPPSNDTLILPQALDGQQAADVLTVKLALPEHDSRPSSAPGARRQLPPRLVRRGHPASLEEGLGAYGARSSTSHQARARRSQLSAAVVESEKLRRKAANHFERSAARKQDEIEAEFQVTKDVGLWPALRDTLGRTAFDTMERDSRRHESDKEEMLQHGLRNENLDAEVRMQAALELVQVLISKKLDSYLAETIELEATLNQEKEVLLLKDPGLSLELGERCARGLGQSRIQDMINEVLEKDAMNTKPHATHPYRYILVDLATWRESKGQLDAARRLWDYALQIPEETRDHRTFTRHLDWRIQSEPSVPRDRFRVEWSRDGVPCSLADKELPNMRPFVGCKRGCPCGRRAVQMRHRANSAASPLSNSMGALASPSTGPDSSSPRSASAASNSLDAPADINTSNLFRNSSVGSSSFKQICLELDRRMNVDGSLIELGDIGGHERLGARPVSGSVDPGQRIRAAEVAAQKLVRARRFKVNLIDVSVRLDSVAEPSETLGEQGDAAGKRRSTLRRRRSSYFSSLGDEAPSMEDADTSSQDDAPPQGNGSPPKGAAALPQGGNGAEAGAEEREFKVNASEHVDSQKLRTSDIRVTTS